MDAWADERALYIWSGGVKADLAPIKAAKERLIYERDHLDGFRDVPALIRPIAVSATEPPPVGVRVLAIGTRPPWLCDYFLVSETSSQEEWIRAFCWVVEISATDSAATKVADTLGSFWPGIREVSAEEQESERRLAAFQQGLD